MSDIDIYFSSLSRADMREILITHGIEAPPNLTRRDMQQLIVDAGIGGPPVETTTDTDTPPKLFGLLTRILLHREASLGSELSRAAMKQRLLGELDAIRWVMQQVEDIIEANQADTEAGWGVEITNEPCNTCNGQGWVVEGQSMGFPSGEQIECPDCGEPPGWPRRSVGPSQNAVMHTNIQGKVMIRSNGKWVEIGAVSVPAPINAIDSPILLPPSVAKALQDQWVAQEARNQDGTIRWLPEDFT